MLIEESIPPALDGERLDRVVSLMLDVSRSDAARIIERGGVAVDGTPAPTGKVRLAVGMSVRVDSSVLPVATGPAADDSVAFDVIHRDADIAVINKPAGLVVHPGAGNPTGTLVNGLLSRFPGCAAVGEASRPGIVHRLDAGTSGLMVVALSARAYDSLVAALSSHEVDREYLALVWGVPESPRGVIDAPIGRSPRDPLRMAVVADGKPARTHYEVLEVLGAGVGGDVGGHGDHENNEDAVSPGPVVSLLRCRLETGRTHQIRVHLSAVGHPVVGDAAYGGARPGIKCSRPMLHACRLRLVHPGTGEEMEFEQAPPEDFEAVVAAQRS